jgi:hypothetical protein
VKAETCRLFEHNKNRLCWTDPCMYVSCIIYNHLTVKICSLNNYCGENSGGTEINKTLFFFTLGLFNPENILDPIDILHYRYNTLHVACLFMSALNIRQHSV